MNKAAIFSKVPEITIYFWVIKILCTTVGETAADFLSRFMKIGLTGTTIIMGIVLIMALIVQFKVKRYIAVIYWLVVVLLSIFGTLITDNLTDQMKVSLVISTIAFSIALAITFIAWYISEKTLSIHSIYTMKREAFYWLAILFTFALGTAAGDLIAEKLAIGYAPSAIIFAVLIFAILIAHLQFKLDPVLAFWMAYILTRPLGASLGDYFSQEPIKGGLGMGTIGTSIVFLLAIMLTVVYLAITKKDTLAVPATA